MAVGLRVILTAFHNASLKTTTNVAASEGRAVALQLSINTTGIYSLRALSGSGEGRPLMETHVEQHGVGVATNSAALEQNCTQYFHNRNPRNLELLGVAKKPRGFGTRLWRVDYYHRLMLEISNYHVSGYVDHNNGLKVAEASTKEFCIARHLHKTCNVSAAYNVGRVLAERCKEMGLYRVMWEHKNNRYNKKVKAFIKAFSEAGIVLNEPRVRQVMPPPGTLPR